MSTTSLVSTLKSVIEKTKKRITKAKKKLDRLNGIDADEDQKVKGSKQLLSQMDKQIPLWNRVLIAGFLFLMVIGGSLYAVSTKGK